MANTRTPESLAVSAAKRVLQQIEQLQFRMRDDNQYVSQLAPTLDELGDLHGTITALGSVLSNADFRQRLRAANPEPVEFVGEMAHSHLEAVFKAGERLFVTCSMLVRHGVEYPFQSRLSGDVNEGDNGLWPPIPSLQSVEYSPGHGGCLRDERTLYLRIRGIIKALPPVSAERGAVVVEKEIMRSGDSEADGPYGHDRWRFAGKVSNGTLEGKPHRLACYLFERLGKNVNYSEISGPGLIFEGEAEVDSIAKQGRNISKFFKDNAIPLTVSTSSKFGLTMTAARTEE